MADEPAGEVKTLDANHPHVKALTNAGIGIDRLTQLVNSAVKPIAHEAVSSATQAQQSAEQGQSLVQQLQALLPPQIPPLNTQTMTNEAEIPAMFQQALSQLVTPPVPTNPQEPQQTPAAGGQYSNG